MEEQITPNSCNDGKYHSNRNHVNRARCKPYVPCYSILPLCRPETEDHMESRKCH